MDAPRELAFARRIAGAIERRHAPLALAVLAVLFTFPSLWSGYYQDDHLIRLRFQGFPNLAGIQGAIYDTCVFGDGVPEQNHARMEHGMLPWWTPEHWKIAFFRPLCALTHWIDWKLFGDRAWVMHVHNLVWYGLFVFALALLYRRLIAPGWVAALAGLLFLINGAHGLAIGWIATRNAAQSSLFIALVLYFHDRWRRDAWTPGIVLALLLLGVGLFFSEATVAAGAYLAAYAVFLDRGRWFRGCVALLPYLAVVIVWRILYERLGYGIEGTLLYADPLREPIRFAGDALCYLPMLLSSQFLGLDPSAWSFLPAPGRAFGLFVAVTFLLLAVRVLWPMLSRDPVARFWALGMVLAALPICTTIPQGRELMNPGIGAMALVAMFLAWRLTKDENLTESTAYQRMARVFGMVWVVLLLVVSAISMPIASYEAGPKNERIAQKLNDTAPSDAAIRDQTLLIVYTPADILGATLPIMRAANGEPMPKRYRPLCAGVRSLDVERKDEKSLIFRPDATFLSKPWSQVFRNPATHPMKAGQTVQLAGMTATVTSVREDGGPREIVFTFEVPLEDSSLRWVSFKDGRYVPFVPPKTGQTIHIDGPSFLDIVRFFLAA